MFSGLSPFSLNPRLRAMLAELAAVAHHTGAEGKGRLARSITNFTFGYDSENRTLHPMNDMAFYPPTELFNPQPCTHPILPISQSKPQPYPEPHPFSGP